MSGYEASELAALDRLEDLLDAYCETRLAPRGAVLARIRANVLAEAAAAAATVAAANRLRLVDTDRTPPRWSMPPRLARVVFGLGFAAALTLGTSAAVLAAPPGSPFYNARVYLETLALPTQLDARVARHEELLDERLAEVEAAAARHDGVGLAAALAAYQSEVAAATAAAWDDATLLAHLEGVLATHTGVLTQLAATAPEQAAIDHAIDSSSKAIDRIKAKTPDAHPTHPPQGGGGPDGDGQGDSRGEQ